MKIDLHSNLPGNINNPNSALGYLKGYITKKTNHQVRNIYWNILPPHLQQIFVTLSAELPPALHDLIYGIVARYLFEKEMVKETHTELNMLYQSPFFLTYNIKDVAEELKTHIFNHIQNKKLNTADAAGFTLTMDQWLFNYYVLVQLKKLNPQIKTIIGGIQSASQGIEFMQAFKEADFAIWGEGEIPLADLLNHFDNPGKYPQIPNLLFRQDNAIKTTSPIDPQNLPDVNTYPFADHSDFFSTLDEYGYEHDVILPIWGSRSCWWNKCKFCVHNIGFHYRVRTPENIIAEIEFQSKKYDTDTFMFADNELGRRNKEEFHHLLNLLIMSAEERKKPYSIVRTSLTPFRIDRTVVEKMQKIAIKNILIGYEAFTDSLLRKMMKLQSYAHNIQVLKLFDEIHYYPIIGFNIIRGIPSETPEDVIESMNNLKFLRFFLKKFTPVIAHLALYKDSPFYKEVSQEEREQLYTSNIHWSEISKLSFLSNANKWELSSFDKDLSHTYLWFTFQGLFDWYMTQHFEYLWYCYSDGSSLIEEYGKNKIILRCSYELSPLETELLVFCDTTKTFSEIQHHFNHINKDDLKKTLREMKKTGLLYFNDDFKYYFISVVSTKKICKVL